MPGIIDNERFSRLYPDKKRRAMKYSISLPAEKITPVRYFISNFEPDSTLKPLSIRVVFVASRVSLAPLETVTFWTLMSLQLVISLSIIIGSPNFKHTNAKNNIPIKSIFFFIVIVR